jgi:hypothetical protein
MNYELCLNSLSLPAGTEEKAREYLDALFQGIAAISSRDKSVARFMLYSDGSLDDIEMAAGYPYAKYKTFVLASGNIDLAGFIFEIEDKSPFIDFASEIELLKLTNYEMKIFDTPLQNDYSDIIKFAYIKDACLLSFPTSDLWKNHYIPVTITRLDEHTVNEREYSKDILNIFNNDTGNIPVYNWKDELENNVIFSDFFDDWFNALSEKNKALVAGLVKRADKLGFRGTIEQAKEIKGSAMGIWEWRGGRPGIGSGRIRVLYKSSRGNHYVLCGFIKTSKDDYQMEIRNAESAFKQLASAP